METQVFNQLVTLLSSSKARDRSDGLELLEQVGSAELSSRQFGSISSALLDLIKIEKKAFLTNPTRATEDRLISATHSLRATIILSLSSAKVVRVKHYTNLVNGIVVLFNGSENAVFAPASLHLARIVSILLKQCFIKDHLLKSDWISVYNHLLLTLENTMEQKGSTLLLAEACQSISHLIYASSDQEVCVSYLFHDKVYLRLFKLLWQLSNFGSEELLAILVLQIVTKLIIMLSTENTAFVTDLIHIGLQVIASHIDISTHELQLQICIFLNVEAVHMYTSSSNTQLHSSKVSSSYVVGSLIRQLIPKLSGYDYLLQAEDIGLNLPQRSNRFFSTNSFYLKDVAHDIKPWLFTRGVALLTRTYFSMTKNYVVTPLPETQDFKRRKTSLNTMLYQSSTAIEYYIKLADDPDPKVLRTALLVLAFFIDTEAEANRVDVTKCITVALSSLKTTYLRGNSFLVIKATLAYMFLHRAHLLSSMMFNQLLKITITLVKDESTSDICSEIIYLLSCTNLLSVKLDPNSVNLIKSLLDSSGVNGPIQLSISSFRFWYGLERIASTFGHESVMILSTSIQAWLFERWESFREIVTNDAVETANFVAWICGSDIGNLVHKKLHDQVEALQGLQHLQIQHLEFAVRIHHVSKDEKSSNSSIYTNQAIRSGDTEELISRLISTESFANFESKVLWHIFLVHLLLGLKRTAIDSALKTSLFYSSKSLLSSDVITLPDFDAIKAVTFNLRSSIACLKELQLEDLLKLVSIKDCDKVVKVVRKPDGLGRRNEVPKILDNLVQKIKVLVELLVLSKTNGDTSHCSRCIHLLETLSDPDFAVGILQFLRLAENLPLEEISILTASRIVRCIGERLLANEKYERCESTFVTVALAIQFLLPLFSLNLNSDLGKDCQDICLWYVKCFKMGLIQTENSTLQFFKFVESMILEGEGKIWSNEELVQLLLEGLATAPNNITFHISNSICNLVLQRGQLISYESIINAFDTPQRSVESSSSFLYLLLRLGCLSFSNFATSVYNITEFASFKHAEPYVVQNLSLLASHWKISDVRSLFSLFKVDIIKSYFLRGATINDIPVHIYGFENVDTFIKHEYPTVVGVAMSFGLLETKEIISRSTDHFTTEDRVISHSVDVAVALSFTKGGIENEIFAFKMSDKGGFSQVLQVHRLEIILFIVRLTAIFDDNSIKGLLTREKSDKFSSLFSSVNMKSNGNETSSIPINTAVQTIQRLYNAHDKSSVWLPENVYFLVRRLFVEMNEYQIPERKLKLFRQIKLVLLLSDEGDPCDKLKVLLVKICNHMIRVKNSFSEVHAMMVWIKVGGLSLLSSVLFIKEVMLFLRNMLRFDPHAQMSLTFMSNLRTLSALLYDDGLTLLFSAVLDVIAKQEIPLSGKNLELYIHQSLNCGVGVENIFRFSECLIEKATKEPFALYSNIAEALLTLPHSSDYSDQFRSWSADYLASFYLGGSLIDIKPFGSVQAKNSEFHDDFNRNVSTLSHTIRQAAKYCHDLNPRTAGAAELFIGGIVTEKGEVSKLIMDMKDIVLCIKPIDYPTILKFTRDPPQFTSEVGFVSCIKEFHTYTSFELWLDNIITLILDETVSGSPFAAYLAAFIKEVPEFKTNLFPHLILNYVYSYEEGRNNALNLINTVCGTFHQNFNELDSRRCAELMLETVLLIRTGSIKKVSPFPELYTALNKAMLYRYCAEYHMPKPALLFSEELKTSMKHWSIDTAHIHDIYAQIDCLDLLAGIPSSTSFGSVLSHFYKGGTDGDKFQYGTGLLDTDIILSSSLNQDMKLNFVSSGYLGLAKIVSQNHHKEEQPGISEADYEWSWKLNTWSLPTLDSTKEHATIYRTLKHIKESPTGIEQICQRSLVEIWKQRPNVQASGLGLSEYTKSWLRLLATMKGISTISSSDLTAIDDFASTTGWFKDSETSDAENILLSRSIALMLSGTAAEPSSQQLENVFIATIHELSRYVALTRSNEQKPQMIRSTLLISRMIESRKDSAYQEQLVNLAKFESARSLWNQGETQFPLAIAKELAHTDITTPFRKTSYSQSYITSVLVSWLSESKHDLPGNIMADHVERAAREARSNGDQRQAEIFRTFGKFCEKESRSVNLNDGIAKLEKQVNHKKSEIDELKDHYGKTAVSAAEKKSVQRYYSKLKALHIADLENLEALRSQRSMFSRKAAQFYLWTMRADQHNSEDSDSFFSVWLNLSEEDDFCLELELALLEIPSFQIVSWCTQLMSRLSTENTPFQSLIQQLVFRVCRDHPYHSIYGLISLRKHAKYANEDVNPSMAPKTSAANEVWYKLQKINDNMSEVQRYADEFADNSVKLAEHKVKRGKTVDLGSLRIGDYWIHRLPAIPSPAMTVPIDYTCKYENVVFMKSIDGNISVAASGLSLPKIGKFLLSDGTYHRALFKSGTDDLRQDSIMEQVFEKVNTILEKDSATRKRSLRVRTYKAIPLGPKAGVIEYVPNSVALIDIIKPYHLKHDSIKAEKAREQMKSCQNSSNSERIEVFKSIKNKVQPVLKEFFADTFSEVENWFESRVLYTRGIATTSIVGYVLGLGDRHCNNILLDKESGEPIHIDLGVAFDQGKKLPIPETVPFRLTRDIVDGFGISGVEGIFRKSCEHTFRVMQLHSDHILVILDVLRWDPLYTWSISPIRRKHLQQEADVGNIKLQPLDDVSEAGKAISTVGEKLSGRGLSVEATVQTLINEATNDENLALIYCGWCPFF